MLACLPAHVRRQAREAYKLFKDDPTHQGLAFKKVHGRRDVYSARVSLDYRAVGLKEGDTIAWFWIGSHADYDQLLKSR